MCYSSHHHTPVFLVLESLTGSGPIGSSVKTGGKCLQEVGVFVNRGAATVFSFTTVLGLVGMAVRLTGGLPWPGFPPFPFAFQCRCLSFALYFLTLAPPSKE